MLCYVELNRIATLGLPILCFDTCSALDLMRDPTRAGVRLHERRAGLELLSALETGPRLIALVATQVSCEFQEHADAVEKETLEAISGLIDRVVRAEQLDAAYGGNGSAILNHLTSHSERARGIADRWMNVAVQIPQDDLIPVKAFKRVGEARTPSRKGKDSIKDCVVIESYLSAIGHLRQAGCTSKVVFASSNTADYAEHGGNLKADLALEFRNIQMHYAPNLGAAKHLLGI